MCRVFKVSKSGYYKWLHKMPSKRDIRRIMLEKEIETEYWASKGRSGSPRITKEPNVRGIAVSKVLVAKIMKDNHLQSIVRKRYKATTDPSHKLPVAENVLDRQFTTTRENEAWVSDITYIATG